MASSWYVLTGWGKWWTRHMYFWNRRAIFRLGEDWRAARAWMQKPGLPWRNPTNALFAHFALANWFPDQLVSEHTAIHVNERNSHTCAYSWMNNDKSSKIKGENFGRVMTRRVPAVMVMHDMRKMYSEIGLSILMYVRRIVMFFFLTLSLRYQGGWPSCCFLWDCSGNFFTEMLCRDTKQKVHQWCWCQVL